MVETLAPLPFQDPVVYPPDPPGTPLTNRVGGLMTTVWVQNLNATVLNPLNQSVKQFPDVVGVADQAGAIGTTPIPLPKLAAGRYRISVFARITTPAAVSSSLSVTIGFTAGGVPCALSTPPLTTNTPESVVSQEWPIVIDEATPITYSTIYASNLVNQMEYSLAIGVEQMP